MANNLEINKNEYLQQCDCKDVVSFQSEKWASINKIKDIVYKAVSNQGIDPIVSYVSKHSDLKNSRKWFFDGEECEILKAGSDGWQKGRFKVNVTLEFIPDELEPTESPLDDVRQEIDKGD